MIVNESLMTRDRRGSCEGTLMHSPGAMQALFGASFAMCFRISCLYVDGSIIANAVSRERTFHAHNCMRQMLHCGGDWWCALLCCRNGVFEGCNSASRRTDAAS